MNTKIKAKNTRHPELTRAVIRQTGRENLEEIAQHGCDGGFAGFTYHTDTVAFFKRNRSSIVALVEEMASDMGESPMNMVAGFQCLAGRSLKRGSDYDGKIARENDAKLKEYMPSVARCLYGGRITEEDTNVANALAWFAAEEIARELNPDV